MSFGIEPSNVVKSLHALGIEGKFPLEEFALANRFPIPRQEREMPAVMRNVSANAFYGREQERFDDFLFQQPLLVAATNADGSNRPRDIRNPEELSAHLLGLAPGAMHLYTLTEMKSAKDVADTCRAMGLAGTYGNFGSNNFTAAFWDPKEFESDGNIIWSQPGKYVVVKLRHLSSGKILTWASVHLPNAQTAQKKWVRTWETIRDSCDLWDYDSDAVLLSGDFNSPPRKIRNTIDRSVTAFTDGRATTKSGTSIDNIVTLYDQKDEPFRNQVARIDSPLSHLPIFSEFVIKE